MFISEVRSYRFADNFKLDGLSKPRFQERCKYKPDAQASGSGNAQISTRLRVGLVIAQLQPALAREC